MVLKVAATDPVSRQTGLALGLYEREVRFYTEVAPNLGGPVAPCFDAGYDDSTGAFHLLLGDAGPAAVGDEIRGATIEQADLAVAELGRLHAPLLGDTAMAKAGWLNRESPLSQALIGQLYAGFVERYGDQIAADHREVCDRLVGVFDAYVAAESDPARVTGSRARRLPVGQHAFRAGRRGSTADGGGLADRHLGAAMTDLAYFLGCALPAELRRAHHDQLLRTYHDALGADAPISLEDVRDGVRRQSFFGVMMAIVSSMLVERTPAATTCSW